MREWMALLTDDALKTQEEEEEPHYYQD